MAFIQGRGNKDRSRDIPPYYPAASAFSSNRPPLKSVMPLEIVSETNEETSDVGFGTEDTEYSVCTSPTATRESSSDEAAKLLVRPFRSSQGHLLCDDGTKGCSGNNGASKFNQVSLNSMIRPAGEKMAKVKVSFQEKAENCLDKKRPSMQTRRQSIEVSSLEVEPPLVKGKNAPYVQPIREKHARALGSFSSHAVSPSSRCFPSLSGRLEAFFQSHLPDILIKLRDAICCRWGKDEMAVDQHSLTEGHRLPDTNMDDLNEMKALLNTINQNLIMLENRGKAHPQLLSSKLAPVYFTT